ncbi:putative F-box and leucine-rich repeat protein 7 [Monocercomonoides exilis]|uniref:putative F-box and leucine-rich repeat protein 7 n=1 Tax=Monocercomonoides exilis TaxID=2049356 RepID=UPI00355A1EAB|nr:putative F-box and leucine-rich repeat protein 7 [Monocercomonoides exilis]|eukprot:MONOS_3614.1-p1 / transcript=MONOS_3614.1 / gene=MONOS_3614 / organism=Monocercomonoides_exilis_PA203 / gene_product=unspecified product / transcript_product=unspecified product / location=Mono_scaffold00086:94756-96826(+) / protein_length=512 / sequence_SO=supercontig / SO=protein_coding / is_pseudo=false
MCLISKLAKTIAREKFVSFNFSRTKLNDDYLTKFAPKWKQLESIDMSYTSVTNSALHILTMHIPSLKHISFVGCRITDELSMSFRPIFTSQTKLESFDFSDTPITEMFLTTIAATPVSSTRTVPARLKLEAKRCPNLIYPKKSAPFARDPKRPSVFLATSMSFANCLDFSDKMTIYLFHSLAPTYSAVLTKLDLTGCIQLTDISMAAVALSCPGLETLIVWNCKSISNGGISCIARQCRHLKYLDVTGCERLTDTACKFLAGLKVDDPKEDRAYQLLFAKVEGVPVSTSPKTKAKTTTLARTAPKTLSKTKSPSPIRTPPHISSPILSSGPKILPPTTVGAGGIASSSPMQASSSSVPSSASASSSSSSSASASSSTTPSSATPDSSSSPTGSHSMFAPPTSQVTPHGFTPTREYGCHSLETLLIGKIRLSNNALRYLVDGCPIISELDIHSTDSDIDAEGIVQNIPLFEKAMKDQGRSFLLKLGGMPKVNGCSRGLKKISPRINLSFIQT